MNQEQIDLKWKCGHTASINVGFSQADLRYKMAMMASTLKMWLMSSEIGCGESMGTDSGHA